MAFLLLALAGIPLTSGFTAKFAVFAAGLADGMAPLVVVALVASAVAAFFYLRVIVLMYFSEPAADGPTVTVPGAFTTAAITLGVSAHAAARHRTVAGPGLGERRRVRGLAVRSHCARCGRAFRRVAAVSNQRDRRSRARRPGPDGGDERGAGPRRGAAAPRGAPAATTFVTETSLHLIDAGGKRFRPLFTLLGAQMGPRPNADDVITAAAVVELIHLATLYHDDVMDDGHHAPRGAERELPLGQHASRSSPATSCSPTPRGWSPTSARRRCGSSPRRSRSWSPARCARPAARAPDDDPVEHYLTVIAEKTGSLIATSGRYGGMFSGCTAGAGRVAAPVRRGDRHGVPDLRRHHRHRLAGRQLGQDARHGPARGRAHAADALRAAGRGS